MDLNNIDRQKINNDDLIPIGLKERIMQDAANTERERRETRRFVLSTIIGVFTAIVSLVAAVAGIISCLT